MNWLNNLSVGKKLFLLIGVPMTLMLLFVGNDINTKYQHQQENNRNNHTVTELTGLAEKLSAFVHESQKERGATAGFLGSSGKKFGDKVAAQRKNTDAKFKELKGFLANFDSANYSDVDVHLQEALANAAKLSVNRVKMDNLSMSLGEELNYYTTMNGNALSAIGTMSGLVNNPKISRQLASYESFLQAKERAGIERGLMTGVTAKGQFANSGQYAKFIKLVAAQDGFLKQFKSLANNEQVNFFAETMDSPATEEVNRMRDKITGVGTNGSLGVQSTYWFEQQTKRINQLKTVENRLTEDLIATSAALKADSGSALLVSAGVGLVAILSLLLAVFVSRGITGPLTALSQALRKVEETGQFKSSLTPQGNDEVGQAVAAFSILMHTIDEAFNDINDVMEKAANGDLSNTVDENANGDLRTLQRNINKTLDDLANTLSQVRQFSATVSTSTEELSANSRSIHEMGLDMVKNQPDQPAGCVIELGKASQAIQAEMADVSQRTEQMSRDVDASTASVSDINQHVQTMANAIEEMSASLSGVAQSAETSAESNNQAFHMAESTQQAVSTLSTAANEIGKVTEMIMGIAAQTNLLALNATIEAASAGEAGKGFAVVANEVKDLAKQSSEASEDIKERVLSIQSSTNDVLRAIEQITQKIGESSDLSNAISGAVQEQTQVTNEISESVASLSGAAQAMEGMMQQTNANTQRVLEAVQTTQSQVSIINSSVDKVTDSVSRTLEGMDEAGCATAELAQLTGELNTMVEVFNVDRAPAQAHESNEDLHTLEFMESASSSPKEELAV